MSEEVKVCGLCKTPLTEERLYENGVEISQRWHHDAIKDHEPLAMDYEDAMGWEAKCDFCFDDCGTDLYSLVSEPFFLSFGNQHHHMSALWAICKPCRGAVTRGWPALVKRMVKKHEAMHGKDSSEKYQTKVLFTRQIDGVVAGFKEIRPTTIEDLIEDGRLSRG